jgi:hypothetical protein
MTRPQVVQADDDIAPVGSASCAARYARLWDCSIDEAAQEFGIDSDAVRRAWRDFFPGVPLEPATSQPGFDPRTRMPMAEADVVGLVERVRAQTVSGEVVGAHQVRERWERYRAARATGVGIPLTMSVGRVGARYAMSVGCSLTEAARAMRLVCPFATTMTSETIRYHWHRLYPGVRPTRASRRSASGGGPC